jgi:hypothetical protein
MKLELEQNLQRLIVVEELVLYANTPYAYAQTDSTSRGEERKGGQREKKMRCEKEK